MIKIQAFNVYDYLEIKIHETGKYKVIINDSINTGRTFYISRL